MMSALQGCQDGIFAKLSAGDASARNLSHPRALINAASFTENNTGGGGKSPAAEQYLSGNSIPVERLEQYLY